MAGGHAKCRRMLATFRLQSSALSKLMTGCMHFSHLLICSWVPHVLDALNDKDSANPRSESFKSGSQPGIGVGQFELVSKRPESQFGELSCSRLLSWEGVSYQFLWVRQNWRFVPIDIAFLAQAGRRARSWAKASQFGLLSATPAETNTLEPVFSMSTLGILLAFVILLGSATGEPRRRRVHFPIYDSKYTRTT